MTRCLLGQRGVTCSFPNVPRSAFRLVAPSIIAVSLALGCREAVPEVASDRAPPPPEGEIRLEPASAKLRYLSYDTVRARNERTIAVLPAQIVMNEDRSVRVIAPVTGRVKSVDVAQGAVVTAGQPLAHIVSGDLAQAASDLLKAEATLATATASLARVRDLLAHGIAARKEEEQATSDEAQARAEAERARARVRQLGGPFDTVAGDFVLRSPIAGVVIDRATNVGAEVRPDNGTTIFTISSIDVLWLTASVYQRDIASVKAGDRLSFTTEAVPGRRFDAKVTYVGDALDPASRTGLVRATLANPDHVLKPQMFGEARLLAPAPNSLTVPAKALVTEQTETVVFVQVGPGVFRRKAVTVGDDDGVTATVTSGLAKGDVVVTKGSVLLAAELPEAR